MHKKRSKGTQMCEMARTYAKRHKMTREDTQMCEKSRRHIK